MLDGRDVERGSYGHIYAQALIQLHKDLHSPVRHFVASAHKKDVAVAYPWPAWFQSHLAALKRDGAEYGGVRVPDLGFAVRLWMDGKLASFGFSPSCPEYLQEQVNLNLVERFDTVFEQGDPYLAALCLLRAPETVYLFGLNAGLRHDKAEELSSMCLGKARELASEAQDAFRAEVDAAKLSMFRPLIRSGFLEGEQDEN